MPAPGSVQDGSPGYGSQVFTFATAGAFIAENIQVNRPVSTARDRKTTGEPGRSRYTTDFASMTCTLQAPSGTAGWPVFGDTATLTLDDNYGPETWIMMEPNVDINSDPSTLRKINVTLNKKNCVDVTTTTRTAPAN